MIMIIMQPSTGVAVPPSLQNIYKEATSDVGARRPDHGNLEVSISNSKANEGAAFHLFLSHLLVSPRTIVIENFPSEKWQCWAKQGVLLLNVVMTVRQGEANSHQHKGWEEFTDAAIAALKIRQGDIGAPTLMKKINQGARSLSTMLYISPVSMYKLNYYQYSLMPWQKESCIYSGVRRHRRNVRASTGPKIRSS